jgi:hypothetical protein
MTILGSGLPLSLSLLMLGTRERVGRASLEGARAFRIEMGVGTRFGAGVAAETFWAFWEFFSVGGDGRFLAGLVRIVTRGGEGASDGRGVF